MAEELGGLVDGVQFIEVPGAHFDPTHDFVFTFVHNPIHTAFSGYLQTSLRRNKYQFLPKDVALHMPCRPNFKVDRYAKFLDQMAAGRNLGSVAYHAFPQALKIDFLLPRTGRRGNKGGSNLSFPYLHSTTERSGITSPPEEPPSFRYDVIGVLANFSSHWNTVEHLVGATPRVPPEVDAKSQHTTKNSPCSFDLAQYPELVRKMCRLYAADFVCFGFDLPAPCKGMEEDMGLAVAPRR